MIIEGGTAIVLAYVLVSVSVIVVFVGAVFMIGWFTGRRRERCRADSAERVATGQPWRAGQRRASPAAGHPSGASDAVGIGAGGSGHAAGGSWTCPL